MCFPELGRDSLQLVPPAASQNQVKAIRSQEPGQLEADSAGRASHQCPQRRALRAIVSRHVSCPPYFYRPLLDDRKDLLPPARLVARMQVPAS
jgi:hypothetical protein